MNRQHFVCVYVSSVTSQLAWSLIWKHNGFVRLTWEAAQQEAERRIVVCLTLFTYAKHTHEIGLELAMCTQKYSPFPTKHLIRKIWAYRCIFCSLFNIRPYKIAFKTKPICFIPVFGAAVVSHIDAGAQIFTVKANWVGPTSLKRSLSVRSWILALLTL